MWAWMDVYSASQHTETTRSSPNLRTLLFISGLKSKSCTTLSYKARSNVMMVECQLPTAIYLSWLTCIITVSSVYFCKYTYDIFLIQEIFKLTSSLLSKNSGIILYYKLKFGNQYSQKQTNAQLTQLPLQNDYMSQIIELWNAVST